MILVLLDRSLGTSLAAALRERGFPAEAHGERFAPDLPDDEWLAALGALGALLVTDDRRVLWSEAARQTFAMHAVGCVVFRRGALPRQRQLGALLAAWDELQELGAAEPRPFVRGLRADGTLDAPRRRPRRRVTALPPSVRRRPRRGTRDQPPLPGFEER